MKKYITKSFKQTQKLGEKLSAIVVKNRRSSKFDYDGSVVLLLYGDLGGGKTTFLQGFAKGLGIKQKVLSPTFVIMKKFSIIKNTVSHKSSDRHIYAIENSSCFYHLDCYRLQSYKDVQELGLPAILKNPENIVAIEWPERIKKILPHKVVKIKFKFISKNERSIDILS